MVVWVFAVISETCKRCAKKAHSEHVNWYLEADTIDEVRRLLTSIPLSDIPDVALIVRIGEISQKLHETKAVAASLAKPRSDKIKNTIVDILNSTSAEVLLGMTEALRLLAKCSTETELDSDLKMLESREESHRMMKEAAFKAQESTAEKNVHPES